MHIAHLTFLSRLHLRDTVLYACACDVSSSAFLVRNSLCAHTQAAATRPLHCRLQAGGGGDTCEDVFSGLEAAAKLSWTGHNRIVFHAADAPCHGTAFHAAGLRDDHPKVDKKGREASELLKQLSYAATTNYFFSHLNNSTEQMVREFIRLTPPGWLKARFHQKSDLAVHADSVPGACVEPRRSSMQFAAGPSTSASSAAPTRCCSSSQL